MQKAIVRNFTHGKLKDGRSFQIYEFKHFCISIDGGIQSGVISVAIDEQIEEWTLAKLAEQIDYNSLPSDIRC